MHIGFNTNVPYSGRTYHVQTEDSGRRNPVIVTLLYHEGEILASRRTDYAHLIGEPDMNQKVEELMRKQHRTVIKELLSGAFTDADPSPPPAGGAEEARKAPEEAGQATAEEGQEPSPADPAQAGAGDAGTGEDQPKTQLKESLDDILLDFIIKRNGKSSA